jgi:hypothetical protein
LTRVGRMWRIHELITDPSGLFILAFVFIGENKGRWRNSLCFSMSPQQHYLCREECGQ